jgi:mono/diheme cytochrome c family protein
MKLCKLIIIACAALLFAVACNSSSSTNQTANAPAATPTPAPANTPVDQLADARRMFGQGGTCARCHGADGAGGEFEVDGKKLKAPSLRAGHAGTHPDAQLAKKISEGGDGMPAFNKRLSPEQINNLVRFIRQDLQAGAHTGATNAGNDNHAAHSK